MDQLLKVVISQDNHVLATGNGIELEPYSLTTARKFSFKNLRVEKENVINNEVISRITIQVILIRKPEEYPIYEFKMLLMDYKEKIEEDWWVRGLIYDYYDEEYKQGIVDVFQMWQKGESCHWNDKSTDQKHDYLIACLDYSSIRKAMIVQQTDTLQVDMALVKKDEDFYYFFGEMFFGARGYMGYTMHTFRDCLIELYENKGLLLDKKIIFLNTRKINDLIVEETFKEIKAILRDFGFVVGESE